MSREQSIDNNIQLPKAEVPYPDQFEVAGRLCRRMEECFMGTVLGAGGVGGSLLLVPFQPAIVRCYNNLGATPAIWDSFFLDPGTAKHLVTILAVANNATPPVLTRVAANNWTIALPTQMAPNAELVLVVAYGFRSGGADGSL